MSTVIQFALHDSDDQPTDGLYEESQRQEAIDEARRSGLSVVAYEYEYSDSYVVEAGDFANLLDTEEEEPITPIMGWQDCRYVLEGTDAEMGDIYRCTVHGSTTIGCEVSCEKAEEAHRPKKSCQFCNGEICEVQDPDDFCVSA